MALEHAQARLSSRRSLRALISPRWLADQAAKPQEARHDLYAKLEFSADHAGVDAFLDGLARTLDAPVAGPYRKVAHRLVGSDSADYRSAVDEMSLATRLTDCGYKVTVSSPDVIASRGPDVFRIELTAPLKTEEFHALQNRLTTQWKWPDHRVMLFVGSSMYRPTTGEREAIAEAIALVASRLPTERTEVDLESIVERRLLHAAVSPGWRGVATATGGHVDFVPPSGIQEAIDKKRSQLRRAGDLMLGVNLGGLHIDSYSWSMQTSRDFSLGASAGPSVDAPTNVVGVLAFNGGVPGQVLTLPIWLPNSARTDGNPKLLQPVLICLGWPGVSVAGRTPDGL
jgi:hypothetical protein